MQETAVRTMIVSFLLLFSAELKPAVAQSATPAPVTTWPTTGWPKGTPASVGLDETILTALDGDLASGKYKLTDSFQVFRCGKEVFSRKYAHDYGKIYAKEAKTKGPLNGRLTGRYNYFDPDWHPYFHGTDLHTMQSISKAVTSVIYGIAITRGDFKAGIDTPILKYFDVSKVKNVDDRKRRITIENLLTFTAGFKWHEYGIDDNDPANDVGPMEATDDWVQYAIDRPMVEEPGKLAEEPNKVGEYDSGAAELLAYIFQKETGQDIETYGEKYLFAPLGIKHEWKRTYNGTVDTEGGLYLNGDDLAKIGYLYLHDGMWGGKQIVSKDWVKQSLAPRSLVPDTVDGEKGYWGFLWWLYPMHGRFAPMTFGIGGQRLMLFPEQDMIVVFTGWEILQLESGADELVPRLMPSVKSATCPGAAQ